MEYKLQDYYFMEKQNYRMKGWAMETDDMCHDS